MSASSRRSQKADVLMERGVFPGVPLKFQRYSSLHHTATAMASEAAILLKDIKGEKRQGRIAGLLKSSAKAVCRGELLLTIPWIKMVPRKDGKAAHNFQLANDPSVTLFCEGTDVAPLSDYEYHLMEAVKSREAHFEVFEKDILDWGSKLKVGMYVHVMLPSTSAVSSQRAVSVIKFIGLLPNEHGILFGVEIQVRYFKVSCRVYYNGRPSAKYRANEAPLVQNPLRC